MSPQSYEWDDDEEPFDEAAIPQPTFVAAAKDLGEMQGTLRIQGTLEFRDKDGNIVGTLDLDQPVQMTEEENRDGDQRSERE